MFVVEEMNGNLYLSVGGGKPVLFTDKNDLIKEVANRIGVSILTSDEVDPDVIGQITLLKNNEKTDWDTEPITHDGIQFNKHFIDLKLKVNSLETEIVKLKNK